MEVEERGKGTKTVSHSNIPVEKAQNWVKACDMLQAKKGGEVGGRNGKGGSQKVGEKKEKGLRIRGKTVMSCHVGRPNGIKGIEKKGRRDGRTNRERRGKEKPKQKNRGGGGRKKLHSLKINNHCVC